MYVIINNSRVKGFYSCYADAKGDYDRMTETERKGSTIQSGDLNCFRDGLVEYPVPLRRKLNYD